MNERANDMPDEILIYLYYILYQQNGYWSFDFKTFAEPPNWKLKLKYMICVSTIVQCTYKKQKTVRKVVNKWRFNEVRKCTASEVIWFLGPII